ncbi:tissue factor pathway inhibitor-like isoform X2 [Protopterus annectens]|uniref:tissue factor pathway inhibitor-like isoform X2 n=1 Tax=Protopterus annectens TaxID=7888 RepID=UPI001CFAE8BE|nr:tissue factor pathway inhibitor-like isoform X2 [Protopterus annectens]
MSSLKFLLLAFLVELLQDVIRTAVLTADPGEGEEYGHSFNRGDTLPPLRLGHHICALKADEGPCKGSMARFFFNVFTQQCEGFEYGGCNGNENNFESTEECQEKCIVTDKKSKQRHQWQVPLHCLVEANPGPCRGFFTKYFYNATTGQCEKFMYGGCLGNENNFMTLEACNKSCIPDNEHFFCKTPADPGKCSAKEKRFFYNPALDRCMPFRYTGCGGNENNFTSRKICNKVCRKGAHKKKEKIPSGKNIPVKAKTSRIVQIEA